MNNQIEDQIDDQIDDHCAAAHFYILTVGESRIGIQGCMKGVVFFTRVTGGAGGAASNGGVPVLWGRGGGSVTGNIFQSLV